MKNYWSGKKYITVMLDFKILQEYKKYVNMSVTQTT